MRAAVGIIIMILGALPLLVSPVLIVWAIRECGPADSSCHHIPYRLIGLLVIDLALVGAGAKLVIGRRLISN